MTEDLAEIGRQTAAAAEELLAQARLKPGQVLVVDRKSVV